MMNFSEHFKTCIKWKLSDHEFFVDDDDEILWSTVHNISYQLGDYFIRDNHAHVCIPVELLPPGNFDLDLFFVVLWSISIVSLLVILAISCIVFEAVCHSKPLYCHLFCFAIGLILLVNRQFGNIPASVFGVFILIFEVSLGFCTFIWLNLYGIQIAYHFYYLRTHLIAPENSNRWQTFIFQCVGVIFLVSILTFLFIMFDPSVLELKTAKQGSIHSKRNSLPTYVAASVLVYANCVWFGVIAFNLRKFGREVEVANKQIHKDLFKLYVVIALTLGVTWVIQMYPIAVMRNLKSDTFWYNLPSLLNTLQGFFLLIAFLSKPSVRKALVKRYYTYVSSSSTHSHEKPTVINMS